MAACDFNRWQSISMSFRFILRNITRLAPFPYEDTARTRISEGARMPTMIAQADLDNLSRPVGPVHAHTLVRFNREYRDANPPDFIGRLPKIHPNSRPYDHPPNLPKLRFFFVVFFVFFCFVFLFCFLFCFFFVLFCFVFYSANIVLQFYSQPKSALLK